MTATPFTVEEARERARIYEGHASSFRAKVSGSDATVLLHERLAATLRKYAQMCEAIAEISAILEKPQSVRQHFDMICEIIERLDAEE